MKQYRSEHAERWVGFDYRPDDIVVSTRSKCGTTWMQMICLTLIHGSPLPAPLSLLSPWIDWDVEPKAVVYERLAAQQHRRVIKTHTPLDGIPLHREVRYIVVGRHPLDVAADAWPALSDATSFDSMRLDPTATVPDQLGVLKDPAAFFRAGSSGEGTRLCSHEQLRRYNNRMSDLTTPEILAWLQQ